MKKPLVTIVAAVLTLAIAVVALALLGVLDSQASTSGSTSRAIRAVVVRTDSADVKLVSGASLEYDLDAKYLLGDPELEHGDAGGVFTVNARCNDGLRCRISVKVTVPAGAMVTVEAGSGELDTSGLTGSSLRGLTRR